MQIRQKENVDFFKVIFFFCTFRSPITRPIQELTRRRILEKKKTPNILSTVFKVERLPQQDHFKVKGYKYKDNN